MEFNVGSEVAEPEEVQSSDEAVEDAEKGLDFDLDLSFDADAAAKAYQTALRKQGIPAASFVVRNVQRTYEKLINLGVKFTLEPTTMASTTIAVFDDTCGNLIQIYQEP